MSYFSPIHEQKSETHACFSIQHENQIAISEISHIDSDLVRTSVFKYFSNESQSIIETLITQSSLCMFFNRIQVPNTIRNRGIGSRLLIKTLDYCCEHNIFLINTVNPYGDLNLDQLNKWYVRNGMVLIDPQGLLMFHKNLNQYHLQHPSSFLKSSSKKSYGRL